MSGLESDEEDLQAKEYYGDMYDEVVTRNRRGV